MRNCEFDKHSSIAVNGFPIHRWTSEGPSQGDEPRRQSTNLCPATSHRLCRDRRQISIDICASLIMIWHNLLMVRSASGWHKNDPRCNQISHKFILDGSHMSPKWLYEWCKHLAYTHHALRYWLEMFMRFAWGHFPNNFGSPINLYGGWGFPVNLKWSHWVIKGYEGLMSF